MDSGSAPYGMGECVWSICRWTCATDAADVAATAVAAAVHPCNCRIHVHVCAPARVCFSCVRATNKPNKNKKKTIRQKTLKIQNCFSLSYSAGTVCVCVCVCVYLCE